MNLIFVLQNEETGYLAHAFVLKTDADDLAKKLNDGVGANPADPMWIVKPVKLS